MLGPWNSYSVHIFPYIGVNDFSRVHLIKNKSYEILIYKVLDRALRIFVYQIALLSSRFEGIESCDR